MYAYQDQYGWAVAAFTDASKGVRMAAYSAPRTFASRAEALLWIDEAMREAA